MRSGAPLPPGSSRPGRDRAGKLRCGLQGCGGAQVPAGPRDWPRWGGAGQSRSGVCSRRRCRGGAGWGGPWSPKSCQATFPCPQPGGREKLSGQLLECAFRSPSANREQLLSPGRVRMRPARTGGAPLRLLLVLSQGKRGVRSPSAAAGEPAPVPPGRGRSFAGRRRRQRAPLLGFHLDPGSQPPGAG